MKTCVAVLLASVAYVAGLPMWSTPAGTPPDNGPSTPPSWLPPSTPANGGPSTPPYWLPPSTPANGGPSTPPYWWNPSSPANGGPSTPPFWWNPSSPANGGPSTPPNWWNPSTPADNGPSTPSPWFIRDVAQPIVNFAGEFDYSFSEKDKPEVQGRGSWSLALNTAAGTGDYEVKLQQGQDIQGKVEINKQAPGSGYFYVPKPNGQEPGKGSLLVIENNGEYTLQAVYNDDQFSFAGQGKLKQVQ